MGRGRRVEAILSEFPEPSASQLIVVRQYKHVGSMIDSDGSTMCDAVHRASSASSAYAPISDRIFASTAIPQQLEMQFSQSLICSRLFYNTHLWNATNPASIRMLNKPYMIAARRIAGDSRFSKVVEFNDLEIRVKAQPPISIVPYSKNASSLLCAIGDEWSEILECHPLSGA